MNKIIHLPEAYTENFDVTITLPKGFKAENYEAEGLKTRFSDDGSRIDVQFTLYLKDNPEDEWQEIA